jgi:hypothetical protein
MKKVMKRVYTDEGDGNNYDGVQAMTKKKDDVA